MQHVLKIEGMTCGGCVRSVENALGRVPGVSAVTVDLASGSARVAAPEGGGPALVEAVEAAGYDARLDR